MSIDPDKRARIEAFCRRWVVAELWLFGSAARGDQRPDSDVDVLARFLPDSETPTWDRPAMTDELEATFGREVDLLSEGILRNPFRRATIMRDRQVLYAA